MVERRQEEDLRATATLDACSEPLALLTRGTAVESWHKGALVVVDAEGTLVGAVGDPSGEVVLRSAGKPFQAAAVVESGAIDAFSVTGEELAVMCGSHSGGPEHVRVVQGLLDRLALTASALVCGGVEHNCSGKHAGMLMLARHLGAPAEGYEREWHPVQQAVERYMALLLQRCPSWPGDKRKGEARDRPIRPLFVGVDGCGVPVMRLTLFEAAWLYACLAGGATPELVRVREAMVAHPGMVGGEERFDTRAMRALPKRLVAKSGAEGVQGLGLIPPAAGHAAVGCFIKVADGSGRPLPALAGLFLRSQGLREQAGDLEADYPTVLRDVGGEPSGRLVLVPSEGELRGRVGGGPGGAAAGLEQQPEAVTGISGLLRRRAEGITVCRGDEKEVLRFLRDEWPAADEETFGRPVEWLAEPIALVVRRHRQPAAVLRGHFTGGVGSVDELIVGRGLRGAGLGSLLLERFEEEAAKRGCGRVVLRAVKDSRAEDFYRARGYRRECVQYAYEFGYDYVRMTKLLRQSGEGGATGGWR